MIFAIATVINVILSTVRGIVTIKGKAWQAALINALSYGFYTYVIVFTTDDSLPLLYKAVITAVANFVGVLIVKLIELKIRPDKLWQITMTFYADQKDYVIQALDSINAHYRYNEMGKHLEVVAYSSSQAKSAKIAQIVKLYNGRYFIAENAGRLL